MSQSNLVYALLGAVLTASVAAAEPVIVRYTEGLARGFPVLRTPTGQKLAQGELTQVARDGRVESRLIFHFLDGSYYDEQATFSQDGTFSLLAYRLVQRGPSFPEPVEASMDRATGQWVVHYQPDEASAEEVLTGTLAMPEDVYNGMLTTLLKNLAPGTSQVVQIVSFTPKPRLVKMLLAPAGDERMMVGDWPLTATRYVMRPQLGLLASFLVTDLPDVKCWVVGGDAPGFVRFEGPLFFMGPTWRIDPN